MENEKRVFTDEAQTQLKRHKAMIDKLQSDNDAMKEELNIVTKEGVLLRNAKTSMTVLAAKSHHNAVQSADDIRGIKDRIEEERGA